jgi:hypothetical protein
MPLPIAHALTNHRMVTLTEPERAAVWRFVTSHTHEGAAREIGVHDTTLRKALRSRPIRVSTAALILDRAAS